jgi:acetate kinase
MDILTVNTGSSSIRLAFFSDDSGRLSRIAAKHCRPGEDTSENHLKDFLKTTPQRVSVIAHRIVHGGSTLTESCIINGEVEKEIDRLSLLAPLHNPTALTWIQACRAVMAPETPQIAVFDTAFYSAMPDVSKVYALPGDLCEKHGIRRYGFHGIAHKAMMHSFNELLPDSMKDGRVISIQLGSGCSITALKNGSPIDTSMGFSPLEGLVMSTRSGDIDPGIVVYLQKAAGFSVEEIERSLNESSGLLGISGISGDMRSLLESGEPAARLAIDIYCYRARKYIGAYAAALGGVDAILIGGGVGENAPVIRRKILENMEWCGMTLDESANADTVGRQGRISAHTGSAEIWVIQVDEAAVLAEEALDAMR